MSIAHSEKVLVVPTAVFHELGHFQGLSTDVDRYLDRLLDPALTQYRPRSQVEEDPSFKQLIPYVIFRWQPGNASTCELFSYRRGSGQGERRLHRLRSVGVGGHISIDDAEQACPYDQGMRRELEEEVSINADYRIQCVGLLNDDSNPVGQVHLGVVHLVDISAPAVESREADIEVAGFSPVAEMLAQIDQFETWSQICLQSLFGSPRNGTLIDTDPR